ncbi:TPA: hypothetical protein ACH3X2_009591 [Trebouxia sp. C0005]
MSVSTGVACNKTTKPLAGDCSFYDLPLTLLYNICGSMDIESSGTSSWSVHICTQQNLFVVVVSHKRVSKSRRRPQIVWTSLTPQLLWRRFAAGPGLLSASMMFASTPALDWYKLKALAQKLFSLLCESEGFLLFYLPSVSTDTQPQSSLLITHFYNSWTIDHQKCTVFTPELNFDKMPRDVISIEARIFSAGTEQAILLRSTYSACQCAHFTPNNQHKVNFAYNSNVDVDAWAAHQAAKLDVEFDIFDQHYEEFP